MKNSARHRKVNRSELEHIEQGGGLIQRIRDRLQLPRDRQRYQARGTARAVIAQRDDALYPRLHAHLQGSPDR